MLNLMVYTYNIYVSSFIHKFIYKFFLSLSLSYVFFFRRRFIWHASINKSKAPLLGFSDAHSERKRRKDIVRVNWGGDRDLLKIAFSVRKSLEWVSLIKEFPWLTKPQASPGFSCCLYGFTLAPLSLCSISFFLSPILFYSLSFFIHFCLM